MKQLGNVSTYSKLLTLVDQTRLLLHYVIIGVGTGGGRGCQGPPIFYPWDFINIHACSADRRDHSVYYVRPSQNGIASYAYVSWLWTWCHINELSWQCGITGKGGITLFGYILQLTNVCVQLFTHQHFTTGRLSTWNLFPDTYQGRQAHTIPSSTSPVMWFTI